MLFSGAFLINLLQASHSQNDVSDCNIKLIHHLVHGILTGVQMVGAVQLGTEVYFIFIIVQNYPFMMLIKIRLIIIVFITVYILYR